MLKFFSLYLLLTILIHLDFNPPATSQTSLSFTQADQLKEINISPTDTIQIQLPMQMGSGQQWVFHDTQQPGFKLISQKMKDVKLFPGGKQYQIFTFQAIKAQKDVQLLRLCLKRSMDQYTLSDFKLIVKVTDQVYSLPH